MDSKIDQIVLLSHLVLNADWVKGLVIRDRGVVYTHKNALFLIFLTLSSLKLLP
jgi:hypothetical protein